MKNAEFCRTVPGAKVAVLFLHGIVGSPSQFRDLVELEGLVPQDWSAWNLCYPGHGGDVKAFGRSSMKQWKAYVWQAFHQLADTHEEVLLVGHSMGTLFSLQLAAEFPQKVKGMMLMQCPLYVGLRLFGILNLIRLPFGWINPKDPYGSAMLISCGVTPTKKIWQYAPWIPRLLELFRDMALTRNILPQVKTGAVCFQSQKDELVSNRSAKLLRLFSWADVRENPDSSHFYYTKELRDEMIAEFQKMCK